MSAPIVFYKVGKWSFAVRTAATLTNYDVLNRLKGMNALHNLNTTANTWAPSLLDDFKEDVNYDANGNILSYLRNGSPLFAGKSIQMDNLTYNYIAGTNKLSSVSDAADDGDYGNDIY